MVDLFASVLIEATQRIPTSALTGSIPNHTEETKMEATFVKKKYCYMKNITVDFDWTILSEVTFNEMGEMEHYNDMEWFPVSKVIELEAEIFEPSVLDQLNQLDKIEQKKYKESMERTERELSPIIDRKAALICLTNQSTED